MRKLTTLSIAVVASMAASAAFAGSDLQQQRMANENAMYFQGKGSAGVGTHNPDYDLAATQAQRNAQRDAAYWGNKMGTSKAEAMPSSGVSQYPSGEYTAPAHKR